MGYTKGPVAFMKSPMHNRAVGYMAEGSAAHMGHSPVKQTDPKEDKDKKTKEESKSDYMNKKLDELRENKPDMTPQEMLTYAQNSWRMKTLGEE